jgi:hypothetical protein
MRLLHSKTLELREFVGDKIPPYAILSHTWGEDELTIRDVQDPIRMNSPASSKVRNCCRQAQSDGLEWAWVDTCCIDKSSSAELSEAINSMYRWYQNAEVCYAYLVDVPPRNPLLDEKALKESRWFTRGWTLQELIAPREVEFYASDWSEIGTKLSLQTEVAAITAIGHDLLRGSRALHTFPAAERMSWASKRQTTREEDRAYSLMGIFAVNMPLLYGEGNRAFLRLQEEIIKQKDFFSLLLWVDNDEVDSTKEAVSLKRQSVLATSPSQFPHNGLLIKRGSSRCRYQDIDVVTYRQVALKQFQNIPDLPSKWQYPEITTRGLHVTLFVKPVDVKFGFRWECLAWTYWIYKQDLVCIYLYPGMSLFLIFHCLITGWFLTDCAVL